WYTEITENGPLHHTGCPIFLPPTRGGGMRLNYSMVAGGALCLIALGGCQPSQPRVQAQLLASHRLLELEGAQLGVTVLRMTYGPGGSSPVHTHECAVVGYVEYGKLRMQLEDEAPAVYE